MTAGSPRLSVIARRLWLGALAASAAYGALLLLTILPVDSTVDEKDFGQEYLLARAILDRVDPYQTIQVLGARYVTVRGYFAKPYPTPHPPTVGLLALPLGLLSYPTAVRVWFGLELACVFASVILLAHDVRMLQLRTAPVLGLALIAWPPVTLELGLGQLMLPLLLALAGAQAALLANRSALAGTLLGVSLLIKPLAWPWLILLVWRRDWRALLMSGVIVLAGGCLSLLAIGVGPVADYLLHVLPSTTSGFLTEATNMSLWTVAPRLGSLPLSGVFPAAAALLVAWWCRRRRALGVNLGMLTTASLLASPIVWYFYLVLALLPFAHVVAALRRRGFRRAEVAAALGVFALMSIPQSVLIELGRGGFGPGILLEPVVALAGLGILLGWLG